MDERTEWEQPRNKLMGWEMELTKCLKRDEKNERSQEHGKQLYKFPYPPNHIFRMRRQRGWMGEKCLKREQKKNFQR